MVLIVVQTIAGLLAGGIAIGAGMYLIRAGRIAGAPGAIERGMVPVYTERGGARFGRLNWSIPFVRITVYKDCVAVSCATHEILLRRGDVTGIERERHLWSQGLRVHHVRPEIPKSLLLWPRHAARLEAALRASLLA
jgi:hypothetical protein